MSERLTEERLGRLRVFLSDVDAGRAASLAPADLRALFAEVGMLRQELSEARAVLAHIAEKLEEHVNDETLSEHVRVSLAVHMTQARISSQRGEQ